MKGSKAKRILVVDDEPDVTDLLKYKLKQAGYEVETINDPFLIMSKAREFNPHLFILDILMPELDGIKICRMIRADPKLSSTPIIFLTALGKTEDRIKGLETGADDYIPKPFDIKELILRIQNAFKHAKEEAEDAGGELVAGPVTLNDETHEVIVSGQAIELTATEFKLLKLLMERSGRVQTRDNLLVNVWNYETDTETRTIDTHIRRLREKLGPAANIIETVRGVGYRIKKTKTGS